MLDIVLLFYLLCFSTVTFCLLFVILLIPLEPVLRIRIFKIRIRIQPFLQYTDLDYDTDPDPGLLGQKISFPTKKFY
jgi:hypothetical protein